MTRDARSRLHEDRGSALVTAIVVLPVLVLMLSFVVDFGNWFVHKRHLQTQADAAVLAGAGEVTVPCSDSAVLGRASQYGGLAAYGGEAVRNTQIGGTPAANIHGVFNSPTYFGQSSPTDPDVAPGGPCATGMIDLKLTETSLPYFFGIGEVDHINAHARVEIRQLEQANNFIPLAVSEAKWKSGEVTFFDQSGGTPGTEIARRTLTESGLPSGQALWDHAASPFPIPFSSTTTRVGVRVALSTTSSTTCGAAGVRCYDDVLFARGYQGTPAVTSGGAPRLRDTSLSGASCVDGYFTTTATTTGSSCTVTISARVDWGVANPVSTYSASVRARVSGGTAVSLSYTAGSGPSPNTSTWTGTLTVPAGAGPLPISIDWEATKGTISGKSCRSGNNNPPECKGTYGTVQRTFSSSPTASGPIQIAQLWRGGSYGINSFQCDPSPGTCQQPSVVVKIAVPGSLAAAQAVGDPVYRMRPLDGNSQTHALDCDSALSNLEDELAIGCGTRANSAPKKYAINSGQACSGYNNPSGLPDPSPCAVTQTGQSQSQIGKGLNRRILGTDKPNACTAPNKWSQFGQPGFAANDPRLVQVILTDWGSFTGSGNEGFPVRQFAAFYITGWQGNPGFSNPCQGNGDDTADRGEIVGHFISYVNKVNTGGAGGSLCDLSGTSLGLCVPVLTR